MSDITEANRRERMEPRNYQAGETHLSALETWHLPASCRVCAMASTEVHVEDMSDINDAKRLIAASCAEAARILGAGVSRPCFQGRYNAAARTALEDPQAQLTNEERRLIASFIEEEGDGTRGFTLRVRLTEAERDRLHALAEAAGVTMSDYVRDRVLT